MSKPPRVTHQASRELSIKSQSAVNHRHDSPDRDDDSIPSQNAAMPAQISGREAGTSSRELCDPCAGADPAVFRRRWDVMGGVSSSPAGRRKTRTLDYTGYVQRHNPHGIFTEFNQLLLANSPMCKEVPPATPQRTSRA